MIAFNRTLQSKMSPQTTFYQYRLSKRQMFRRSILYKQLQTVPKAVKHTIFKFMLKSETAVNLTTSKIGVFTT